MPRLRRFTADVGGAVPPGSPRATAASFGGQQAAALGQAAEAGLRLSDTLTRIQERRDKLAAQRDAAVVRERAVRRLDELRQTGQPVTDKFTEFLDAQLQELREARTTTEGLAWAERVAANIQTELGSMARRADAQLAGDEAKAAAREAMQSNGVFLQSAPEVLPEILMEQRDFVNGLDIPENLKEPMLREMQAAAARNAAMGWISASPRQAKEMLEEGRFDEHLMPDDRLQLISRAETRIRAEEEEIRAREAEMRQQRAIESAQLMNDAIVRLNSPDPEERMTSADIAALAEQTFADGTPKLSPSEVDRLFNLRRQVAEEGAIRSDRSVMIDLISRLDRVSEDELIERASSGELSVSDFRWMMETVRMGDTPLRKVRTTAMRNLGSYVSDFPQVLSLSGEFGRMQSQAILQIQEREQEYRDAGKSPLEYYRDGTFEADMRQLAAELDVISTAEAAQSRLEQMSRGREVSEEAARRGWTIGSQITTPEGLVYVYIGGPVDDYDNSYVLAEELYGE